MRVCFEQQLSLGRIPIPQVEINLKSRHQLPPTLLALQYIFSTEELNRAVFALLEKKIPLSRTGRSGMSLWEILVLSVVRLNLNIDYDFLLDLANEHRTLRGILGVGRSDFEMDKEYKYQTVLDNVSLLDESTVIEINEVVVKAGHQLIKKKSWNRQKWGLSKK